MKAEFDDIDLKILAILQNNTDGTAQDVGEQVGISTNACWRRMRALQQNGTVMNRVALLNPVTLGCPLTVFAKARPAAEPRKSFRELTAEALTIDALSEMHRIAGTGYYRLRIRAADIADYDTIARDIEQRLAIEIVDAEFSVEQVKYTSKIPLPFTAA